MQLLRKVAEFSTSIEDKKSIYILYIRSILEQSSVVWHSSLTQENCEDLERVQKAAVRIIIGNNYTNYEDALIKVNLDTLESRRKELCTKFANKSSKSLNERAKNMFPRKEKIHQMNKRNEEVFIVNYANTERLKKSSIPYMQRILNCESMLKEESVDRKRKKNDKDSINVKRRAPG